MTTAQQLRVRLMIEDDWFVDDLASIEECSAAETTLLLAIASTEGQLEDEERVRRDGAWAHRARSAIRYKRAALHAVQQRRSDLRQKVRDRNNRENLALRRKVNARLAAEFFRLHPEDCRLCIEAIRAEEPEQ